MEAMHPVLERLQPLLAGFAARGDEIEQARQLPPDVSQTLIGTGVFKLCVPEALHGYQANPKVLLRAIEMTAEADGSVGWNSAHDGRAAEL